MAGTHQQVEGGLGGVYFGPGLCNGVRGAPIKNIVQR